MSLPCLFFLKTLKCRKTFRSPKGSVRYLNLVVMANKWSVLWIPLSFLSLEGLSKPSPLSCRPVKLCNFRILYFFFPSWSFLKSIIHQSPLVCLLLYHTIPVAMTRCELANPLALFFQMFAWAGRVTLPMLSCCNCLQVTQPVQGSQQIFSIYVSPQLLSFFIPGHPFYS